METVASSPGKKKEQREQLNSCLSPLNLGCPKMVRKMYFISVTFSSKNTKLGAKNTF